LIHNYDVGNALGQIQSVAL